MTDGWDERTEAMPGTKGDGSFELDMNFESDFASADSGPPGDETAALDRPNVVVFEPTPLGLAKQMERLGYAVRGGSTGVDVMSLVSEQQPSLVMCAPSQDSERRRLLAAALRLRFPHIPVVYVSTHAAQEEAVLGAVREGARAVLAWPLPDAADVARVLGPYVRKPSDDTELVAAFDEPARRVLAHMPEPPTDPQRPSGLGLEEPRTQPSGVSWHDSSSSFDAEIEQTQVVTMKTPHSGARLPSDALKPLPVPLPVAATAAPPRPATLAPARVATAAPASRPSAIGFDEHEPNTQPGLRPAPQAAVEAHEQPRGEIGALLAAISPFLWSLEDAARWADGLAASGDTTAASHARAMHLLAKILAQLQARIDQKEI